MIHLSDLWAPEWQVKLDDRTFEMRPLNLRTFADLEGAGLSLNSLAKGAEDKQRQTELSLKLFMFLAQVQDEDPEELLGLITLDPRGFKAYSETLQNSLKIPDDEQPRQVNRRQVKTGRKDEDSSLAAIDMSGLLMFSRLSGISLADLSQMSFAGYVKVTRWLDDNPPQPNLGGLI